MTLRVAITRAMPDAERTAERVRAYGADPVLAPLLTIIPCGYDTSTEGAQALIFTSSNGVRAFPDRRGARDKIVLTVGEATGEAARAAGFADVRTAGGDVRALAELIKTSLDPGAGNLVHVRGTHVAGDLAAELAGGGFKIECRIAYTAVAVPELPVALLGPLDLILFHSPRAAATFRAFGAPGSGDLACACLSPAVAAAAGSAWKRVIVAPAPRESALLEAALGFTGSPAGASA
ncbi:MAG: uroporphyrinogen-III synthase [Terricaulis sp.]